MVVILKKPSENYEETFRCDYIEKKLEYINEQDKEVILRFRIIETKFEKDDKESVHGYIPFPKESNNQYEAKNSSMLLDLKFPEPTQFSFNYIILTEIIKKLNMHNDVDKMVLEQTDNDDIIIALHPGLLNYTFKLFSGKVHVW